MARSGSASREGSLAVLRSITKSRSAWRRRSSKSPRVQPRSRKARRRSGMGHHAGVAPAAIEIGDDLEQGRREARELGALAGAAERCTSGPGGGGRFRRRRGRRTAQERSEGFDLLGERGDLRGDGRERGARRLGRGASLLLHRNGLGLRARLLDASRGLRARGGSGSASGGHAKPSVAEGSTREIDGDGSANRPRGVCVFATYSFGGIHSCGERCSRSTRGGCSPSSSPWRARRPACRASGSSA